MPPTPPRSRRLWARRAASWAVMPLCDSRWINARPGDTGADGEGILVARCLALFTYLGGFDAPERPASALPLRAHPGQAAKRAVWPCCHSFVCYLRPGLPSNSEFVPVFLETGRRATCGMAFILKRGSSLH